MSHIDLETVNDLLVQAQTDVDKLHMLRVDDSDSVRVKRAENARALLRLADSLELASNLVRNQYWITKGYDDLLERG